MSTNIDIYKKQLEQLKNTTEEKKDNPRLAWNLTLPKPEKKGESKKITVRILPYKWNTGEMKDFPFITCYFHYNLGKYNTVPSLKENFKEENDPLDSYIKDLFKQSNDIADNLGIKQNNISAKKAVPEIKALWDAGYRISSKTRIYVPVIVRKNSSLEIPTENPSMYDGIKFWGMQENLYKDIMMQVGDIMQTLGTDPFDPYNGFDVDIIISNNGATNSANGKPIYEYKAQIGRLQGSTLPGKDNSEIDSLINSVPDIWDVFLERKDSDYVAEVVSYLKARNSGIDENSNSVNGSASIDGNSQATENASAQLESMLAGN
jgi:hypothetical protein